MDERGSSRDFDFWLGEWDVFGPQERQAGRNSCARPRARLRTAHRHADRIAIAIPTVPLTAKMSP